MKRVHNNAAAANAKRQQRRLVRIFSRYNEGIRMSKIMEYSVTKEDIANYLAHCIAEKGYDSVVDACGGAGGNSIAFARAGLQVAYVELNEKNLEDAMHNAEIYGIQEYIYFHHGDALEFNALEDAGLEPENTFYFSSPEWGGPSYRSIQIFNLETLNPSLSQLLEYAKSSEYKEACVFVPRTSDRKQAAQMGCYKFEYLFQHGKCDGVGLWFRF